MMGVRPNHAAPPVRDNSAPVVLIGGPSPLRSAVARQLRAHALPLACADSPELLSRVLPPPVIGPLSGLTVVFVTAPRPPRLASRLHPGYRALAARFEQAVETARRHGAARVIVLSTVFRYADDGGLPLGPDSDTLTEAEVAQPAAAERAADLFACLGGDAVVLRLGWTWGIEESITRRVLAAAGRGWRLIDGDPDAWLAVIAEHDAARAVIPALTAPPGCYDVTDGFPVRQATLNARLSIAVAKDLHPLDDPWWGLRGVLFGHSRRVTGTTFTDVTGWRPHMTDATRVLVSPPVRSAPDDSTWR